MGDVTHAGAAASNGGPSAVDALDRLVDAAQNVISDQIDLARLETRDALRALLVQGALLVLGLCMVGVAWAALMVAADDLIGNRLPPWLRHGTIALVSGGVGVALAIAALRQDGSRAAPPRLPG